jgi:tetratricopeptide (TPR) repeat protein
MLGDYEAARTLLEGVVAGGTGLEARIALARVYGRLGDFGTARKHLEQALSAIESRGGTELAPLAHASLGEVAYESGDLQEARAHFDRAVAASAADLPDAASVEARCYRGLLDASGVKAALSNLEGSVKQSKRMGRLYLEVRCRLNLARVEIGQRQYGQALEVLDGLSFGKDATIGPELQAQVHYWRGRALAARGNNREAEPERAQARALVEKLRQSLPDRYHASYTARADIRPFVE